MFSALTHSTRTQHSHCQSAIYPSNVHTCITRIGSWFDMRGDCFHVLSDPVSCPLPPHGQEGLIPSHFILTGSCKVAHVVVAVPEEDEDTDRRVESECMRPTCSHGPSPCQDELIKAKVLRVVSNLEPKVGERLSRCSDQQCMLSIDVEPESTETWVLFHPGFVQVDVSITLDL